MTPEELKAEIDKLASGRTQSSFDEDPGTAPYKIGACYLIRTVTNYYTGRLVFVGSFELAIEEACWIADTGRFSDLILSGTWSDSSEIEPIGKAIIGRGAIVDAIPWTHPLPNKQK